MDDDRNDVNRHAARLLHRAHLRFQRDALRRDTVALPCTEVRGVRFRYSLPEWLQAQRLHQRNAVCNGLRSNFWRCYIDTIVFMSKK